MSVNNTTFLKAAAALLLAAAMLFAAPAAAQEQPGEQAEGEEARATGPQMQRLFFTAEQRRVLEALRQGLVESELLEDDDFIPVVLREEAFDIGSIVEEDELEIQRGEKNLYINALVRRHSDGKTFLWVDSEQFDVEADNEYLRKVRNLVLKKEEVAPEGIVGVDKFTRRRFKILVGQSISTDGQIREELPVIVVNKKN